VTQADDRLIEMPSERGADASFGVREVDEQRPGSESFDVACDAGDQRNRAQRMGETTRSGVFAQHVLDAMTTRDLEVVLPPAVTVHLHRDHDCVGAGKRIGTVGGRPHRDLPRRRRLERRGDAPHALERAGVHVDEPNRPALEHCVGVEIVEGREPERGRTGTDQHDRWRLTHVRSVRQRRGGSM
jgi:hypothetical protein